MRNEQEQILIAMPDRPAGRLETAERESASFKDALRLQESFTAPLERKVLPWLAARLPAAI